jgi:molecular chaperone IbpA
MNMLMHNTKISPEFWKGYWRHSIGFDRLVDTLLNSTDSFEGNYPPYDIVKESDYDYKIVMALAGFTDEDISVEKKEQVLTISGESKQQDTYLYKGIANRKFKKIFPLTEGADVTGASLKDGLLEVNINIAIPEEKMPKLIPINTNS